MSHDESGLARLSYADLSLPVGDEVWTFARLRLKDRAALAERFRGWRTKEILKSLDGQVMTDQLRAQIVGDLASRSVTWSDLLDCPEGRLMIIAASLRNAGRAGATDEMVADQLPAMTTYDEAELVFTICGLKETADPPRPPTGDTATGARYWTKSSGGVETTPTDGA